MFVVKINCIQICRLMTRALINSSPFKESELVSTQHHRRCKHSHIPVKHRINQRIPAITSYLLSIHLSSYSSVQVCKQKQQFRQVIQDTERFIRFFSPITLLMIDLPAPTMQRNMMLLMTLTQMGYTFLYFITEASFNKGMNVHVYITYRHIVGGFVMLPFAYFLERNKRPKITWALFLEISVLSLLGVSLTLNMYFTSLKFTSPSFVSSMVNTIASLTFVIAVILRLEKLDVKSPRGMAKIIGTVVSLAGVTTMTLYKGPAVKNLWGALIHIQGNVVHESWLKGSILTVLSCITWSIWYIMQAVTLKRYPAQLSLTTWMNFIGGAQSAVFTVCIAHRPADWTLRLDINLWSILYAGVVCSGLIIFIQLWCTEEKGPVFVTMFNPLSTMLVAVLAYFVFGEKLYMGSIIGGVIVITGLYLVLWGKEKDQDLDGNSQKHPYLDNGEQKGATTDPAKNNRGKEETLKGPLEV